jgi:hypothetical protein
MLGIIKRAVSLRIVTWIGYVCPAIVRIGEIRNAQRIVARKCADLFVSVKRIAGISVCRSRSVVYLKQVVSYGHMWRGFCAIVNKVIVQIQTLNCCQEMRNQYIIPIPMF